MPPYTYPPTPPTLRKIVELGVVAVPSLLAHLTDARATKLELLNPGIPPPSPTGGPGLGGVRFGSIMYNDEYDPRYRSDPARIPTTVNTFGQVPHGSAGPGDSYQVKVGDLCYVLLGQIVNRSLIAARYQATGSAVINSPIQNSALAEAARKDWANLTVEQHRASLEADATNVAVKHFQFDHFWSQHADAMERLAFYYPALAKGQALAMLTRPSADWHSKRATDFIGKLLAEPDATARDALLVAAQKQWGTPFILLAVEQFKRFTVETPPELADASAALPSDWTSVSSGNLLQHRTTNGTGTSITTSYPHPQWDRAKEALNAVAAHGWEAALKGHEPVPLTEQINIIKGLPNTPDPASDQACVDLFQRAFTLRDPAVTTDPFLDQLANACIDRLSKTPEENKPAIDKIKADLAAFHNSTPAPPQP